MTGRELVLVAAALVLGAVAPTFVRRLLCVAAVRVAVPFGLLFVVLVNGVYILLFLLRIVPALELPPAPTPRSPDAELRELISEWGALAGIDDILSRPEFCHLLPDEHEDAVRQPFE
jgi:hypothetical protein